MDDELGCLNIMTLKIPEDCHNVKETIFDKYEVTNLACNCCNIIVARGLFHIY